MLEEHIKDKVKILEGAASIFLSKVLRIERRIFKLVKEILLGFDIEDGKVKNILPNRRKIFSLDKKIARIFEKAGLDDELERFLVNFDKVERLNRLIYENSLPKQDIDRLVRLGFDEEKLMIVDDITFFLTDNSAIKQNLVKPIRDVLTRSVIRRMPLSEVEDLLKDEILSTEGSSSKALRYVRQVSGDALNQYDGAINDRIRDELGLDGFSYIGSIKKTTRQNCFDMVNSSGKYADLAVRKGVYRVEDIPEILSRANRCTTHHTTGKKDCGSGFNDAVTPETFGQYRMGWGCGHTIVYRRL